MSSSTDSELERKKRKAKKALEDLAKAAGLLRNAGSEAPKPPVKPDPVPVPPPPPAYDATSSVSNNEEDYGGKWRPMAFNVKLGRSSDEPEVEESRMVYMREEKKAPVPQMVPIEPEEELPPGN